MVWRYYCSSKCIFHIVIYSFQRIRYIRIADDPNGRIRMQILCEIFLKRWFSTSKVADNGVENDTDQYFFLVPRILTIFIWSLSPAVCNLIRHLTGYAKSAVSRNEKTGCSKHRVEKNGWPTSLRCHEYIICSFVCVCVNNKKGLVFAPDGRVVGRCRHRCCPAFQVCTVINFHKHTIEEVPTTRHSTAHTFKNKNHMRWNMGIG